MTPTPPPPPAGVYRHYRNRKLYLVLGTAHDTATNAPVVVYVPLYNPYDSPASSSPPPLAPMFTRPLREFVSLVPSSHPQTGEERLVPRFTFLGATP